jgi:hypothetical protein
MAVIANCHRESSIIEFSSIAIPQFVIKISLYNRSIKSPQNFAVDFLLQRRQFHLTDHRQISAAKTSHA